MQRSGQAYDRSHRDEAIQIFPRYHAVDAILFAVEELDPDDLPPLDELTELLTWVCAAGETAFTRNDSHAEPPVTPPLPYRRTLSEAEARRWARGLERRWGVEGHEWYPLLVSPVPFDVTVLKGEGLTQAEGEAAIRSALDSIGVGRVIELRQFRDLSPDRVIARDWFIPACDGIETLWTDQSLDWIAYASHEDTVAFGGTIRTALECSWPDVDRWRWQGWETRNS